MNRESLDYIQSPLQLGHEPKMSKSCTGFFRHMLQDKPVNIYIDISKSKKTLAD